MNSLLENKTPSPYSFALDKTPSKDLFDYELMIFHNNCSENLHSPLPPTAVHQQTVPVFMRMAAAITSQQPKPE